MARTDTITNHVLNIVNDIKLFRIGRIMYVPFKFYFKEQEWLRINFNDMISLDIMNFLSSTDPLFEFMSNLEIDDDCLAIMCHGRNLGEVLTSKVYVGSNHLKSREITIKDIKERYLDINKKYKYIILFACNAGKNIGGPAQQIANELKINVYAPIGTLWVHLNERIVYVRDEQLEYYDEDFLSKDNQSKFWKLFTPEGDV